MRLKAFLLTALALAAVSAGDLHAQYTPIPNYVGIGAGLEFRNDINNHLSGVTPIAPRMVSLPLAQLPAEQDGQLYWCSNCDETVPCSSGGSGALALGLDGQWSCSAGTSIGNTFPLTADSSAGGHRITNLAPNTTTGDALSQGQSHLNDLAAATAAYSMGGNLLTNLAGAVATGEALVDGQSGATLYGANFTNGPVTGVPTATALGQALSWGQNQAQLTVNQAVGEAISQNAQSPGGGTYTSTTVNAPANIVTGNALLLTLTIPNEASGGSVTWPTGFTQLAYDASGNWLIATACKTATGSEPASYTVSWPTASYAAVGVAQFGGISCGSLDFHYTNLGSATGTNTIPAASVPHNNDEVITIANGGGTITSSPVGINLWNASFIGVIYSNAFTSPTSTIPAITWTSSVSSNQIQVQELAFSTNATVQSSPLIDGENGAVLQTLTGSVNKVLNVQAPPYNAHGDGATDDTSAIQEALDDSCGGVPPNFNSGQLTPGSKGATVYIPATLNGYVISAPLRVYCGEKIKAEPGTKILRAFGGSAALLVEGYGDNLLTYGTSLVGSGGHSLTGGATCSPSTNCGPINLDTYLNAKHFNVTFAQQAASTGLQIDFWMKAADTGNYNIIGSYCPYTYPAGACTNGMFQFNDSAGTTINADVETTGGQIALSCTGQTLTNATLVTLSWDKSNYRLFANGTVCQTVASTNAPVMSVWESAVLPDYTGMQQWDGSGGFLNNTPLNGWLDSIRFEYQALNTANFTPPTTKFAVDGSTYLLWNPGSGEDGTAEAQSQTGPAYFQTLNGAEGSNPATGVVVDGGNWCAGNINANGNAVGDALFASWSVGSTFKNMSCPNASFIGYDFWSNDYFDTVGHNSAGGQSGGHVSFNFGNAFNSSYAIRNSSDTADMTCFMEAGNEFYEDYNHCTDRGGLWMYEDVVAAQGGGYIGNFFADAEAANTTQVAGLKIQQISLPVTLNSFDINTRNGAPYLLLDAPNASVVVENPAWDTYGESTPASYLVGFTSAPASGAPPVMLIGGSPFPTSVPISNYTSNVELLGTSNTLNSLELRQAPTLDAGLNHIDVNAIADPSAAAISVVGATGSSSYGPYFVVCHDANGGTTNVSTASNTVSNGPAALSASDYIKISWGAEAGCASWDVLKGTLSQALATGVPGTATSINDTGQATVAYTAPARNTTGDVAYGSILVSVGMPYAKIPAAVVNGGRFYCTDCDPPANPPAACTHIGTKTGSWVDGVNGQWLCVP